MIYIIYYYNGSVRFFEHRQDLSNYPVGTQQFEVDPACPMENIQYSVNSRISLPGITNITEQSLKEAKAL